MHGRVARGGARVGTRTRRDEQLRGVRLPLRACSVEHTFATLVERLDRFGKFRAARFCLALLTDLMDERQRDWRVARQMERGVAVRIARDD